MKKRMKFLINNEECEEIVEEIVRESSVLPIAVRDCVVVKKQQEFYNYRSFLNKVINFFCLCNFNLWKGPFEFYLNNFLLTEADINLMFQETSSDFPQFLCKYEKIQMKKKSSKKMPEPKKPEETKIEENIKFRPQPQPQVQSIPLASPSDNSKPQETEQTPLKYIFLVLIILGLIGLRVLLSKWFQ